MKTCNRCNVKNIINIRYTLNVSLNDNLPHIDLNHVNIREKYTSCQLIDREDILSLNG